MPQSLIWTFLILGVCLVLILARWQAYTQTLPAALTFTPVTPNTLPSLDTITLQTQTEALVTLGFAPLEDTLVTLEKTQQPQQLSRLYWHPSHACYAQLKIPMTGGAGGLAIISLFNNNWSLYTTSTSPTLLELLTALDRVAWSSHPRSTPADLLCAHLNQRKSLTEQQKLEFQSVASADLVYTKAKEETLRRKQVAKRQNLLLSFAKGILVRIHPPHAGWG
jgi:hypothetical protein